MELESPSRQAAAELEQVLFEIKKVIVGQEHMVERLMVALLARGHILLEGVPGLAKTLAVSTLAKAIGGSFVRLQFTPDLLPSDLVGTRIWKASEERFDTEWGPVFANLVLTDEINRAPAKVQSALLEAMQEKQVTLGGETTKLPDPFLVMATQNPLDQEGTYPLPEAQMDRFMMKVVVNYPSRDEEREVLRRMSSTTSVPSAKPVAEVSAITAARSLINEIYLDPKLEEYILDLIFVTRTDQRDQLSERQKDLSLDFLDPLITAGASPRATLQMVRGARTIAFLEGRAHVLPEDIKAIAKDVLRHRLIPSYEAQAENMNTDDIIQRILDTLHTP